jgi:hypothetical protein
METANTTTDSTAQPCITTFTVTVKCPYSGQCASEGSKCGGCAHNPQNQKHDYYQPIYPNPWRNPWSGGIIWCTTGSNVNVGGSVTFANTKTQDYYQSK